MLLQCAFSNKACFISFWISWSILKFKEKCQVLYFCVENNVKKQNTAHRNKTIFSKTFPHILDTTYRVQHQTMVTIN